MTDDWTDPELTESAFLQSALTSRHTTFEEYTYERTRLAVERERSEMIEAATQAGRDMAEELSRKLGMRVAFREVQLLREEAVQ